MNPPGFELLAAEAPITLRRKLAEQEMHWAEPTCQHHLAAILEGLRRALRKWAPRPPLDPAETDRLSAYLRDTVNRSIDGVIADAAVPVERAESWAAGTLTEWNTKRPRHKEAVTVPVLAAKDNTERPERTMDIIESVDGTFRLNYERPKGD